MSRQAILKAVRAANLTRRVAPPSIIARQTPQPTTTHQQLEHEFTTRLQACGVIVERLETWSDVPAAVVRHVTAAHLPLMIRHGADPLITALPWNTAPELQRRLGAASPDDLATLSRALFGISETGTLLLGSGAGNPVTLAFLPELHIVVLGEENIAATMEDALAAVGEPSDAPRLPRTVNLISGASRTGDIGGRLVMGAHGPRQLVVLLAGGDQENGAG